MTAPAGGPAFADDNEIEEAIKRDPSLKERIRYTPGDGHRVIHYGVGQIPDLPEYPHWELPRPHCDLCWVTGLEDPNLPGATNGTING